jgi:UTP--glucose-1-phosphate uridylyltransferase
MNIKIKKVIIPVAGFGTRFLPFTKVVPKEMLPVLNVPLINLIIKEAQDSGIEEIILITSKTKPDIKKNFVRNLKLEKQLLKNDKMELYRQLINDFKNLKIHFVYQSKQKGLGHAILMAKSKIKNEPFAVMLGDELITNNPPALKQCMDAFYKSGNSILGVRDVPKEDVEKYGIVKPTNLGNTKLFAIDNVVEKPKISDAPSTKAILGRYIFTPHIFKYLQKTKPSVGNEIQLTDAIKMMLKDYRFDALSFEGKRYDFGTKIDFLRANIDFALHDKKMHSQLIEHLKKIKV